jgi:hypothetical protein
MIEAPPMIDDSEEKRDLAYEYVKSTLIKKSLKIECRGINGVTFVRRNVKEEPMRLLVVEDDVVMQKLYERQFNKRDLFQAYNLEQARKLFVVDPEAFDVVVVDGCVENVGKTCDTEPFIQEVIASGFKGPIVATSGDEFVRQDMLKMGCTHECEKHELVNKLKELGLI